MIFPKGRKELGLWGGMAFQAPRYVSFTASWASSRESRILWAMESSISVFFGGVKNGIFPAKKIQFDDVKVIHRDHFLSICQSGKIGNGCII